ncbi:uncharacterized protein LOC128397275 [Panonychus citri]|uniref:uncharacterized protein LOC128397275 n=1 Tax=Panonychus citri TaxID=50023 RepID=UPI0023080054|nr:uncharacterized protein LOC128397275 [Panonychus citri]
MKLIVSLIVALCLISIATGTVLLRRREQAYRKGIADGIDIGYNYNRGGRNDRYRDNDDYLYYGRPSTGPSSAGSFAGPDSSSAGVTLGSGTRGTSLGARAGSDQSYGSLRTNSEAYGNN